MFIPPAAEVITIGDELCRGEIVDTNATWLAERLTEMGFRVVRRTSVTDDREAIVEVLGEARRRGGTLVVTGGLGPTDDDRTVDAAAALARVDVVIDEAHRARMEERWLARGLAGTPEALRQVRVPRSALVLTNPVGLAPGFALDLAGRSAFFLPGVPREMKAIFAAEIAPRLERLAQAAPATRRLTWRIFGLGESLLAERLAGLTADLAGVTLHDRIAFPEVLLTAVVTRPSAAEAEEVLERLDGEVCARLGRAVVGHGHETLPALVGERLRARGETLATAESCSGGLLGDLLTDAAGASSYYHGGIIAYSNDLKIRLLGVHEATLADAGAVSEACVREMAEGVRLRLGSTWALAISGIAGPAGGTPEKPVGLVHCALAGPTGTRAHHLLWPGERRDVKRLAAFQALHLLVGALADDSRREP